VSWIFSKALLESLPCSQGRVGESSPATFSDGEPFAQLNVMPTPQQFWRNDKTMDVLKRSPFGLTWRALTEDRGEELLTLYREVFPVRTSPAPEKEQASKGREADSGENLPESLARFDRDTSSWRTAQCLLFEDSTECLETLPRWGTTRNGELWERTMPEHLTSETASGSWPTPTSRDHKGPGPNGRWREGKLQLDTLDRAVQRWPTPRTPSKSGGGTGLDGGSGARAMMSEKDRKELTGGTLNPPWVEWLMGWPIGWTDLNALEMDRFQQWQHSHGEY